jgi:hypothetical protein
VPLADVPVAVHLCVRARRRTLWVRDPRDTRTLGKRR